MNEQKEDARRKPRSPETIEKIRAAVLRRRQLKRIREGRCQRSRALTEYWAVPEDFDEMGG